MMEGNTSLHQVDNNFVNKMMMDASTRHKIVNKLLKDYNMLPTEDNWIGITVYLELWLNLVHKIENDETSIF